VPVRSRGQHHPHSLHRLNFSVRGKGEAARNVELVNYLAEANVEFDRLDERQPLRAKLAQFPQFTFGHVVMPQATVVWPRDKASLERAVVILVQQGTVDVESDAEVVSRGAALYLVPPGVVPVQISAIDTVNEFIYISVSSALIADIPLPREPSATLSPFSAAMLTPLATFITTLCAISPNHSGDTGPLVSSAAEVIRSIVRLATDTDEVPTSVFDHAMQIIVREYADRELTVLGLAATLKVSRRTLQAAFAAAGTTVSDELRDVRARAALKARSSGRDLSAGEVAHVSGFGSESAMFRALRKHLLLHPMAASKF
jgi:AraC-like DNA-binding protein